MTLKTIYYIETGEPFEVSPSKAADLVLTGLWSQSPVTSVAAVVLPDEDEDEARQPEPAPAVEPARGRGRRPRVNRVEDDDPWRRGMEGDSEPEA